MILVTNRQEVLNYLKHQVTTFIEVHEEELEESNMTTCQLTSPTGSCCVIGHALLTQGKDRTFLRELDDTIDTYVTTLFSLHDLDGILSGVLKEAKDALEQTGLTKDELYHMQVLNDEQEWEMLLNYLNELLERH